MIKVTNDWDDEVEEFATALEALASLDVTVEDFNSFKGDFDFHLWDGEVTPDKAIKKVAL